MRLATILYHNKMSRIKNNCYAMQQNEFTRTRVVLSQFVLCNAQWWPIQNIHQTYLAQLLSQHIHLVSPIKFAHLLTEQLREEVAQLECSRRWNSRTLEYISVDLWSDNLCSNFNVVVRVTVCFTFCFVRVIKWEHGEDNEFEIGRAHVWTPVTR